jgi:hypothetical protein
MLAIAARSSQAVVASFLDSCSAYARTKNRTEAQVMQEVGLAIAEAMVAHRNQRYSRAADLLLPVKDLICRIGGSHAQRDLFEHLLIDSILQSHRLRLAHSLLEERIAQRPCDLWAWRQLESISEKLKDRENVALAKSKIDKLLASVGTSG